ncbi:MAG TPA: rod shape-determining protein MreD [Candidatus Krumholzibacteria bacterium]|nr:rod shape-determining protein MreD [Candidatus Krumholzibacteria bacterium]
MKWLGPIVGIVVYLALQAAVAHRIAIGAVEPDFVVVCVVLFGLQRGPIAGSLFGFVVGLVVDLGHPGTLGLNGLTKSIVGYAAGRMGAATSPGVLILFVVFLVASFMHDVIYLLVYMWPHLGTAFVSMFTVALPSALYTAVAGILVERLLALLGAKVVTSLGQERQ